MAPAQTRDGADPAIAPMTVTVGGYLQPQFRMRQNSPAQFDQDGFKFARARAIVGAKTTLGDLELSAFLEAEMQPQFALQDAYGTVARAFGDDKKPSGKVTLDAGQMRVPVSRQNLLSDSRLSFVDKAQIATIAPDRDLGARLTVAVPAAPVRLIGGVFNGEGKNQVENINESYLFAGRLEIAPWGRDLPLAESAFGGTQLVAAVSYARNKLSSQGNSEEIRNYIGGDLAFSYEGLSGAFEYLMVLYTYKGGEGVMLPPKYKANGWAGQLAYLLPVKAPPYHQGRVEIGARLEEIDRNDTIPIPQLGDPNQSVREITGVLTYYLRMHNLKAQLAFNHFTEIEDRTVIGSPASYKNDQLILQVTYRLE